MSAWATGWAWEQEAPSAVAKLVLIAASDVGGWGGGPETVCSWASLENATGLKRGEIEQIFTTLEAAGLLVSHDSGRFDGSVLIVFPDAAAMLPRRRPR